MRCAEAVLLVFLFETLPLYGQEQPGPPAGLSRRDLEFLAKVAARRPFSESREVLAEPQSIGQFFTPEIYARLVGNEYYGYALDEGFAWDGSGVAGPAVAAIPGTRGYREAFALSLDEALRERRVPVNGKSSVQIGVCLVGVAESQTAQTFPGVMLEVFFTNRATGKSFFWRFGTGSRDGFSAALVDAADILAEMLLSKSTRRKER